MEKIIKHQFSYAHPKEMVWEYLTNSELMAQWLMKNDFQPVVGHEFHLWAGPIPALNFDGVHYCKVLEIIPFQRLSYTWNTGPDGSENSLESIVTWTLRPTEKGTELTLEHRGFAKKEDLAFYNGLANGWVGKLEKVDKLLKAIMKTHDFTTTFLVDQSPKEVFTAINKPQNWWPGEIEGSSAKLNDEFTYRYKDIHFSRQRVVELVPDQKVVWLVTDSSLNFTKDVHEWTDTRISFEITGKDGKTELRFSHIGLVPGVECYNDCSGAWTQIIHQSLVSLITSGEGRQLVLA